MANMQMKIVFDDEQMQEILAAIAQLKETICGGCPFLDDEEAAE